MDLLWLNSCHTAHPDVQTVLLLRKNINALSSWNKKDITQFRFRPRTPPHVISIYEFIIFVYLFTNSCYSLIVKKPLRARGFTPVLTDIEIITVSYLTFALFIQNYWWFSIYKCQLDNLDYLINHLNRI